MTTPPSVAGYVFGDEQGRCGFLIGGGLSTPPKPATEGLQNLAVLLAREKKGTGTALRSESVPISPPALRPASDHKFSETNPLPSWRGATWGVSGEGFAPKPPCIPLREGKRVLMSSR